MKTGNYFVAILALLTATLCKAQLGDSCGTAIVTSLTTNPDGDYHAFTGGVVWLRWNPDTADAEFLFLPDSISATTNIEGIEMYSGTGCASLVMVWAGSYSDEDSSASNTAISLRLAQSGNPWFVKVMQTAGGSSGFRLKVTNPETSGGCIPACPDLIANGSFSLFSPGCILGSLFTACPDPFNRGCICGWGATHGSPNYSPVTMYPVMGAIRMGGSDFGEGIFQQLQSPVSAGNTYLLSFDYQNSGGVSGYSYNLNVKLTNSTFSGGTCFSAVPNNGWDIPNTPVPAVPAFTTIHRCFTSNSNYSTIRFYPTTGSLSAEWVSVDNVSLEVLDAPIPDVTINCGETAALCPPCPGGSPLIHYLWSTGETTACISVSPVATTGYTLTVSVVENGNTLCSVNVPVTVNVIAPGPVTMTSGSTQVCKLNTTEDYCFDSPGAMGFGFSIAPPNAFTLHGNCISVNWTNIPSGCATMNVAAITGPCTQIETFSFCLPCQGNPAILTFCDATASAILNDPVYAPYISGGNIFTVPPGLWASFHGTFTVDVPFVFNKSDIRFGPDARIKVSNSQYLEVVNKCHLHSCDGVSMWDGIYTDDPSSLVYIHDGNNLVEDAKNAVVSNNGGIFEINSTTFNNNYIGIQVNGFNGIHQGTVWGCTFAGTGTLLNPYAGYCSLDYPLCGIQINNVDYIRIGEPLLYNTYGRNIFHHLLCGISSNFSNLDVYTSEFNNMLYPNPQCDLSQGCGIYTKGMNGGSYKVNVGNVSPSEQCFFDHCRTGILEQYNCSGDIQYNTFTHCETGIQNNFSTLKHNMVKGNAFEDFKRGIYFYNAINQLQYGLEIYENRFNASMNTFNPLTYGKEAINVSNAVSSSTNLWVTGNEINYSRVGIFIRNVWEPCQVTSNTINFDILPADALVMGRHHGIECENDNGLEVNNNFIRWRNQHADPTGFVDFMNGISINYSSNTTAISGGISENKIGPYPAANTGQTYGMGSGINISSNCLGLSLYCNKMTRCEEGVTFKNAWIGDQGYYDHNQNWYSNGNTFAFTPSHGGNYRVGGTVANTIYWPNINALEDPTPFEAGTVFPSPTTFSFTHCQPPEPGNDLRREANYGTLVNKGKMEFTPDFAEDKSQLKNMTGEKFYAYVNPDSAILHLSEFNDSVYASLFSESGISEEVKFLKIKTVADSMKYSNALQSLLLIVDSTLMERNRKIAMQVYLETFAAGGNLDPERAALLEPIAGMNPVLGGEAVFWACAMLDREVNNDLPPSRMSGENQSTGISKGYDIRMFPNPARDVIHISYGTAADLCVAVSDVTGKTVLEMKLENNSRQVEVNTSLLEAGMYQLKVLHGRTLVYTDRLIIIR